ncbi:MAG: flagellar basal body P-ring formation protein FlgA [bacterium]|nr:flagellar basal body P-ring formation protein FlgA [bacterium]
MFNITEYKPVNPFNRRWTLPLLIFMGVLWLFVGVCNAQTKITLKDHVVVEAPTVTLGDLADIEGELDEYVGFLEKIRISTSPTPGIPIRIRRSLVNSRLSENKVKLSEIDLKGAETVKVELATEVVDGQEFVKIAKEYINNSIEDKDVEYVIDVIKTQPSRLVPKYKRKLKPVIKSLGRLKGTVRLWIGVYNDEKLFTRIPVYLQVRTFEKYVVAGRSINKGTIITEEDLKVIEDESTDYNNDLLTSIEELIGKEAKFTLRAGLPVKMSDVDLPKIIKRGDRVDIVVARGGITVKSQGVAQRDGRIGDLIPVLQTGKRKPVNCTVTGASKVVIE